MKPQASVGSAKEANIEARYLNKGRGRGYTSLK